MASRGVACSVYGALGWALVPFTAFVAFMRRFGWSFFVAFRVFVAFMGHWGGTLVAFTALVVFMRRSGWSFYFIYLFILA